MKNIFKLKTIKHHLKQNSWEWFRHRKNYVNASEIGTIMNLNPYETTADLIKKKIFGSDFVVTEAIKHGKIMEPKANLYFCVHHKRNYQPSNFTRGILSASLDGYHEESNSLLEIKCPLNPKGTSWKDFFATQTIPPYYWAQVQAQIFCSQVTQAYFYVFINQQENYTTHITLDPKFCKKMYQEACNFQTELLKFQNQYQQKEV
ncbi:lambda-exonuclease family protein [Candidatus Phytoplasma prunorum]|uniref:lambda-exonuclease family protein n=1 Tax=Candidatus Phytoplasma prunorum TaxID=47565 RepID=UPI002FEF5B9E